MRFDIYQRGQRDRLACRAGQDIAELKEIGEGWARIEAGIGNVRLANGSKSIRQIEDDVAKHGRSLYSLNRIVKAG